MPGLVPGNFVYYHECIGQEGILPKGLTAVHPHNSIPYPEANLPD